MTEAISGKAGPSQTAALQLVHEIDAPGATAALAQMLAQVDFTVQLALIEGLTQREDPSAAPAIAALVTSADLQLRLTAIAALGALGNHSVSGLLAGSAASPILPEPTPPPSPPRRLRLRPLPPTL